MDEGQMSWELQELGVEGAIDIGSTLDIEQLTSPIIQTPKIEEISCENLLFESVPGFEHPTGSNRRWPTSPGKTNRRYYITGNYWRRNKQYFQLEGCAFLPWQDK